MKNKMTDLRDHLFETLEALKDPDKPMVLSMVPPELRPDAPQANAAKPKGCRQASAGGEGTVTHREFVRKHPEFRCMPEFITGAGDKRIRFMDATLADFRHYQALLTRRIARRERRAQARRAV